MTATHINYFFICLRKLWLFGNGIGMEHTSDAVADGRLIGTTTYPQRPEKYTEVEIGGSKIDFYDARNKVVHEIKRSDKVEEAHQWQVKYYIWLLKQSGVAGVSGILEYPKLRQTTDVALTAADEDHLQYVIGEIERIVHQDGCPPVLNKPLCKNCSYHDFCYIEE